MPLVPCAGCGCHVRAESTHCPSCGAPQRARGGISLAAGMLGLVAVACVGGAKDTPTGDTATVDAQTLYGVTTVDYVDYDGDTDTDTDADSDTDTDTDTDTSTTTDTATITDSGTTTVEPLYGVTYTADSADTGGGGTVEPLYGVSTSTQ